MSGAMMLSGSLRGDGNAEGVGLSLRMEGVDGMCRVCSQHQRDLFGILHPLRHI